MARYTPWYLSFTQAHDDLCDTPFCYISRDNCAIPNKNKHENVCDTIATSIAQYEKYRCWASKDLLPLFYFHPLWLWFDGGGGDGGGAESGSEPFPLLSAKHER